MLNWNIQHSEEHLSLPLDEEIKPVHPKGNQSWIFTGRTHAEAETPILWPPDVKSWLSKRPWCWERLKVGGEGDDRGWDGWMASLTQWTWVLVDSSSWWWTGRANMLQSMESHRVGHDWRTDAFELWCQRRLLRVAWTARRSNESVLKEISPEYSLEGLMLKLKLPILWPPDAKNWLIGKDPDAGKNWRQTEKGMTEDEMVGWHHWLNGHEF